MESPTTRSLKKLRKEGYTCAIVEHWNQFAKIRQDLYGFIDIIAIRENEILGVQTTSGANTAARKAKILAHKNYPIVIGSGIRVVVHGWRKLKAGWACKEESL